MSGAYGEILIVQNRLDGNIYALKKRKDEVYNKHKFNVQFVKNLKYIREASNMMKLSHPNIVRAYDWWLETSNTFSQSFSSETTLSGRCLNDSDCSYTPKSYSFSSEENKFNLYILMEYVGDLGKPHNLFSYTK